MTLDIILAMIFYDRLLICLSTVAKLQLEKKTPSRSACNIEAKTVYVEGMRTVSNEENCEKATKKGMRTLKGIRYVKGMRTVSN